MATLILYHGSDHIVERPIAGGGKVNNDYGQGFYCTQDIELAKEWASANEQGGFCNAYKLNQQGLRVLDLNSKEYSVLNWMAMLAANRVVNYRTGMEKKAAEYLVQNYLPETKDVDLIKGYRADDSYFSFARAFFGNAITIEQLEKIIYLGNLGEQICIKSEKAFASLTFMKADCVSDTSYHQKRNRRNTEASQMYNDILSEFSDGTFMRDIISGK